MPARSDLHWSQLKVGLTIAVAAVVLVVAIFAMTGDSGWFTHKINLVTYVDDAGGMRAGASVNLEGVIIGSVTGVGLAPNPPDPKHPVQVKMEVTDDHQRWLRTDSVVELGTQGPLGETLVNIAAGSPGVPPATNGTVLPAAPSTGINDILISTHSVVENANLLEERMGQLLDQVQNGQGALGKLFYSSELYDRFNASALNLQKLTDSIQQGQGTLGKLVTDDTLYNKVNATLDNMNGFIAQVRDGQGTAGKLINDPSLYNNANQLIASMHQTLDALNHGQGTLGGLLNDPSTLNKLNASLDHLNSLLVQVQSGNGSAAKFINDPALYNSFNDLSHETQALIQAIKTNPKKYLTIHLNIF